MIQPIDFQNDNIIGLHMTGTITEDDIKPLAALLDRKSEQSAKLRAYIEIEGVEEITFKAILQDIKFDVMHLGDFEKAVVVSGKTWINLSASVAKLVPGLEVEQFSTAEKEQARQWIQS